MRKYLLCVAVIGGIFALNISAGFAAEKDKKPYQPNAQSCPTPYMKASPDGRCVWSCSEGTKPDKTTWQCICRSDKVAVGLDQFGRRICQSVNDRKT